jgi:hypothetical protein
MTVRVCRRDKPTSASLAVPVADSNTLLQRGRGRVGGHVSCGKHALKSPAASKPLSVLLQASHLLLMSMCTTFCTAGKPDGEEGHLQLENNPSSFFGTERLVCTGRPAPPWNAGS